MNTVGMSTFLPNLRHLITGPLDVWMEEALFDAVVQFCRQTELVTLNRTISSWLTGQEIEVSTDYDFIACQILRLNDADGIKLTPGVDYHALSPNTLTALTDLAGITLWYAVEPSRESVCAPELVERHYTDVICNGAAAALFLQPDKPWTDPGRAAEYQARFTEGIRHAARFRKQQSNADRVEFDNPVRTHSFY